MRDQVAVSVISLAEVLQAYVLKTTQPVLMGLVGATHRGIVGFADQKENL